MTIDPDGRNDSQDWRQLGDAWRLQPVLAPDIDALRREARRRTRRMAALSAIDVVATLAGAATATWFIRLEPGLTVAEWAVAALVAVAVAFTGWTGWSRRRLWRDDGLGAEALLALEMRRARNAIHYWRLNTVLMSAILAMVLLAATAQSQGWIPVPGARGWWSVLAGVLPLLLVSIALDRWRGSRLRQRLGALQALADELQR